MLRKENLHRGTEDGQDREVRRREKILQYIL